MPSWYLLGPMQLSKFDPGGPGGADTVAGLRGRRIRVDLTGN